MRIESHRLVPDSQCFDLTRRDAPNRVVELQPDAIVLHYDVCHDMAMNTAAQFASGLFYHVAVDGTDTADQRAQVRQYVPFNRRGAHAKGWNHRAIGLVIVNPGPLVRGPDGRLRTTYGKLWPEGEAIEATHGSGLAPKAWQHWATFSHRERDAVLELCRLLVEAYPTIRTICGHDFTAPGNKFDLGPAGEDGILAYVRGAFPALRVPETTRIA